MTNQELKNRLREMIELGIEVGRYRDLADLLDLPLVTLNRRRRNPEIYDLAQQCVCGGAAMAKGLEAIAALEIRRDSLVAWRWGLLTLGLRPSLVEYLITDLFRLQVRASLPKNLTALGDQIGTSLASLTPVLNRREGLKRRADLVTQASLRVADLHVYINRLEQTGAEFTIKNVLKRCDRRLKPGWLASHPGTWRRLKTIKARNCGSLYAHVKQN